MYFTDDFSDVDVEYLGLVATVLECGEVRPDRTGTGTVSVFQTFLNHDLSKSFPLLRSKKVHFKSVVGELLWFLSGSQDVNDLRDKYGVTIWDEWAGEDGSIGPMYGSQWRRWSVGDGLPCVDQIAQVVESIKADPYSRRHVVSAWNPSAIPDMALAPCHVLFQFYVSVDNVLSLGVYQRSAMSA